MTLAVSGEAYSEDRTPTVEHIAVEQYVSNLSEHPKGLLLCMDGKCFLIPGSDISDLSEVIASNVEQLARFQIDRKRVDRDHPMIQCEDAYLNDGDSTNLPSDGFITGILYEDGEMFAGVSRWHPLSVLKFRLPEIGSAIIDLDGFVKVVPKYSYAEHLYINEVFNPQPVDPNDGPYILLSYALTGPELFFYDYERDILGRIDESHNPDYIELEFYVKEVFNSKSELELGDFHILANGVTGLYTAPVVVGQTGDGIIMLELNVKHPMDMSAGDDPVIASAVRLGDRSSPIREHGHIATVAGSNQAVFYVNSGECAYIVDLVQDPPGSS